MKSALASVVCLMVALVGMVHAAAPAPASDTASLRRAIADMTETFGSRYPRGTEFLKRLDEIQANPAKAAELQALRKEALLANPLINFEKLLLVKRADVEKKHLGLPQNWQGNCALPRAGYDNEIAVLSPVSPSGKLTSLYKPAKTEFVGDVELNYEADKMLFSSQDASNRWQVFEMKSDGTARRQVTPGTEPDVDNYDPCYRPDGKIIFASTRCFAGVPCVGGANTVANLCVMDPDGKNIRQLCFDQEHNWCPTVLNDGRILYARWEYTDTAHYFTRLLFHMNPDGTAQAEYYGSNSYWPNSIFYARPIPDHPTAVVAIISGHHGVPRMGEMVIFDPAKSRREAAGAIQKIPGYGKPVQPIIADGLVNGSWPKFLHPFPLSEKYFIVSAKLTAQSPWGIYLVDIFDNMTLIHEQAGYAMLEPIPFRATQRPPVIPDKVRLDRRDATVYIADIYAGEALKGVPRGAVKSLRIFEPHYAYPQMGGHINIGIDGPWDVHRIHGTVPVLEDGSASFMVPANTPLAIQPLDAEGKAVQLMRSWFTAMPGEVVSCTGCHDMQHDAPAPKRTLAAVQTPVQITPWYGPARGFDFKREVQPVLDKYCVGCHNPSNAKVAAVPEAKSAAPLGVKGQTKPDRRAAVLSFKQSAVAPAGMPDLSRKDKAGPGNFTPSYIALHPYVRRPGPESDYHLQVPLEFHADTSELIQMLKKGHYNVKLDKEAWDRLITWIDLNVPDHGTWGEHRAIAGNLHQRRLEMRTKYANNPVDPEAIPPVSTAPIAFVKPQPLAPQPQVKIDIANWPFDAADAKKRQAALNLPPEITVNLDKNLPLTLELIPPGEYIMGDHAGDLDESPQAKVKIARAFYMAKFEVTNELFARFDPAHDSAYISVTNKDQSNRGAPVNQPKQPVVRVTWKQALAFCDWLSAQTGKKFSLPTEAQWEYACRAGTDSPLSFGEESADFSKFANLADDSVAGLCHGNSPRWMLRIEQFKDGAMVTSEVGKYKPNAFGLYDMHGNAAEWTLSTYRPYPYRDDDGRNDLSDAGEKVVRGGSWYDRPFRATSSFRLAHHPWQKVYNVGFRVICDAPATTGVVTAQ